MTRSDLIARFRRVRLYVLLTGEHCRGPLLEWAEAVLAAGAHAVQLREKGMADRPLLDLARRVRALARRHGALFVMNDRPDLAVLAEADALHLGQDDLPVPEARRIVGPEMLVGLSTHSLDQIREAVGAGADYIGVGPVFATGTKGYREGLGIEYVRRAAPAFAVPAVAIGGIRAENAREIVEAGAQAVAVCGAILSAEDPAAETRRFLTALAGT